MKTDNSGKICDIVIPVLDKLDMTRECLDSIYRLTSVPFNLILIDNHSGAETRSYLEDFSRNKPNCTLLRNGENLGWVKAVNQGMRMSRSPYVCIMNNDAIAKTEDWLNRLIDVAEADERIGLVNPTFEIKKNAQPESAYIEVDFCRGYCVLIKKKVVETIGYLDEAYGLGYYDDDDYSVRAARTGFRCVRANRVFVEHLRDSTFSALFSDSKRRALHENNKNLFYSKWGRRLRVAFILTKGAPKVRISDVLFSLVRRQHIVYLWNVSDEGAYQHINIREKVFPEYFQNLYFYFLISLNRLKKRSKRYDIIFVDNERMKSMLSRAGCAAYFIDLEKDMEAVGSIADSASRS